MCPPLLGCRCTTLLCARRPNGVDLQTKEAIAHPERATCNEDAVEPTAHTCLLNGVGQCNEARSLEFGLECKPRRPGKAYARVYTEAESPCPCSAGFDACKKKQGTLRLINGAVRLTGPLVHGAFLVLFSNADRSRTSVATRCDAGVCHVLVFHRLPQVLALQGGQRGHHAARRPRGGDPHQRG